MRLAAGARLGPYEIVAPLGAGGMGEVYRAQDTRLGRDVAVKILSPDTSSSAEARQRFEREARTISQFSHPHICALFDVGESTSPGSPVPSPYLVMELLEGETLAQRLASGALPLELTLRCATEIADALDKAHRAGIAHRDLKPANVMITRRGVKLLDFGLAKAGGPAHSALQTAVPVTAHGVIAGTVQYMAPEVLAGRPADARSDLYALGAVIYEMATGRAAFGAALTAIAPPALDRLVRTCMAADPDDRWQAAHDVYLQLRAIAEAPEGPSAAAPRAGGARGARLAWAVAAIASAIALASGAAVWEGAGRVAPRTAAVRFAQPPTAGGAFYTDVENTGLSVSPDGLQIAFTARDATSPRRVWLRAVGELDAAEVPGTDGATSTFWSPDGRSIAYFAGSKLRRVDLPGGTPVSICDVREGIGFTGTWGGDGQILFASVEGEAILRVAASGGEATAVLKPDAALGETRLNWPLFLPDGRRFLYLDRMGDGTGHLMLSEPGRPSREVMPLQSNVQYVAPGYLVFGQEGALVGRRFDLARGEVVGAPFSIAKVVKYFFSTSLADFAASPSGTLVFQSHEDDQRLVWFDRTGREVSTVVARGQIKGPRISPDERRVAFDRLLAGAFDVWETDLSRGVETRLTFDVSSEGTGPWSPDGTALFFNADHGAPPEIFRRNLLTSSDERVLPASGTFQRPQDVSPDGKVLLYTQRSAGGDHIWSVPLDGSRPPALAVDSPFEQEDARFSPDGRYFAYVSAPSGRMEVFVSPFPPTGERVLVSTEGGYGARWAGGELVYLSGRGEVMSVRIQTKPSLHIESPVRLFTMDALHPLSDLDVTPSGRILAVVVQSRAARQPLTVALNWTAALDR